MEARAKTTARNNRARNTTILTINFNIMKPFHALIILVVVIASMFTLVVFYEQDNPQSKEDFLLDLTNQQFTEQTERYTQGVQEGQKAFYDYIVNELETKDTVILGDLELQKVIIEDDIK